MSSAIRQMYPGLPRDVVDGDATESSTHTLTAVPATVFNGSTLQGEQDRDKVLPLPGWLVKVYFIFPVVLYIPDAVFNAYVYSDGWNTAGASPLVQVGKEALVAFLAIGVVGMAYLLSVLAPWHWGQGHHIQAFFCALGVVIATAVTVWNSLAYRSNSFVAFKTDQWAASFWPRLAASHISLTMLLVSLAPPFWGLFWALVQPTTTGRSVRQLQESHAEKLLRVQHEAEVKRLKAETNATVREAQLRGMARTAAAARTQAAGLIGRSGSSSSSSSGSGSGSGNDSGHEQGAKDIPVGEQPAPTSAGASGIAGGAPTTSASGAAAASGSRSGRIRRAIDLSPDVPAPASAARRPATARRTTRGATPAPAASPSPVAPVPAVSFAAVAPTPVNASAPEENEENGENENAGRRGSLSHVTAPDHDLPVSPIQRAPGTSR